MFYLFIFFCHFKIADVNDLSFHAQLLQTAGANPSAPPVSGFPWIGPPVFPTPWSSNTQKLQPFHALLSHYIGLPQGLASLGSILPFGFNSNVFAHNQLQQQQQRETQLQQHSLFLDAQNSPQNLSSKDQQERDDESVSSDDEIRRQSAQVLRVKAEEIIRKSGN